MGEEPQPQLPQQQPEHGRCSADLLVADQLRPSLGSRQGAVSKDSHITTTTKNCKKTGTPDQIGSNEKTD